MTTVYDLSLHELTGRLGAWCTLRRLGGPGNSEANL
jgi:hypothetical protein